MSKLNVFERKCASIYLGDENMLFRVNVNYNISKKPIKQSTRRAYINHERRFHSKYSNKSINSLLSKYNSYNTYFSYKKAMIKDLKPYIIHHNNLKSVKNNPRRKIKNVHELLLSRGTKIPYKFITLKIGSAKTKAELIHLFKNKGYTRKDYSNALNCAFDDYGKHYNNTSKYLKYDHLDSNLDESLGGDHAHIGCISLAKTSSGKVSFSFDRGTKCEYKGRNNRVSWRIMQHHESINFLKFATYEFQKYLGPNFQFKLTRNTKNKYNHLEHNEYVKLQQENDRLRQALCSVDGANKQVCGDLKKLIIWKKKVTNLALETLMILRYCQRKIISQKALRMTLKKLEENNKIFQNHLTFQPNPRILKVARWLCHLSKSSQLILLQLSDMQGDSLISSLSKLIVNSKIRNGRH